jgi:hypothetical protein
MRKLFINNDFKNHAAFSRKAWLTLSLAMGTA